MDVMDAMVSPSSDGDSHEIECHRRISGLLERWAGYAQFDSSQESDRFEVEYLRGYAQALLDSAMHLRDGDVLRDGFFGELLAA